MTVPSSSGGPRPLSKEEFVSRFLARRAKEHRFVERKAVTRKQLEAHRPRRARPLVRDDGVRFESIAAALKAAGYAPKGTAPARDKVDNGTAWRDGHVYMWA